MSVNLLNPIENQVPDLPMIKLDVCPFDIQIAKNTTPEKIQFMVGCVDGTIRYYTARPTEEWWRPDTYEDYEELFSEHSKYRAEVEARRRKLEEDDDDEIIIDDDEEKDLHEADLDEDEEGLLDGHDNDDRDGFISDDEEEDAPPQFDLTWQIQFSDLSIRGLAQVPTTQDKLCAVTRDGKVGVIDIDRGSLIQDFQNIHKYGYEKIKAWDENLFICGDEQGTVMGYDIRCAEPAFQKTKKNRRPEKVEKVWSLTQTWMQDDHADYITGIAFAKNKQHVAFTSADKHVSIYDVRTGKFKDISERDPDELMSVCYLKEDAYLLCGTEKGPISLYDTNDIAYYKTRYKVHNQGINHIVKLDEDTVLTTCEDGIVRVIMIDPSRVIGVVGVHSELISGIDTWRAPNISHDDFDWATDIIGTTSHDYSIRFWRMQDMQMMRRQRTKKELNDMKTGKKKQVEVDSDEEFGDFGDFDGESDSEQKKNKKKRKVQQTEAAKAQAVFNADKFRKLHNPVFADAYEKVGTTPINYVHKASTATANSDRVKPLPELGKKQSKTKKIKHGGKNFFNGL